jgi:hypothetical protein
VLLVQRFTLVFIPFILSTREYIMCDGKDLGRAPNHDVADSGSEHVPDHEVVDSSDGQAVQNSPVSSHDAENSGQENEHNPALETAKHHSDAIADDLSNE